jgi:GxxExxY protein
LPSGEQGAKPARRPNDISQAIVTAALKVHSALGPGLLESAYEACLLHELRKSGFSVASQIPMPIVYDGVKLDVGYRIDVIVESTVIAEIKAVEAITNIHIAQILSYLKLSNKSLGLILNFNVLHLREGIKRVVNGTDWKNPL